MEMFKEIWKVLSYNKMRTFLTAFSVTWGIFILIILLGAGNGVLNAVKKNNSSFLGSDLSVWGGRASKSYKGNKSDRIINLKDEDIDFVLDENFLDKIDNATVKIEHNGDSLYYKNESFEVSLSGVYPDYSTLKKVQVLNGRFINNLDISEKRKIVIIPENLAKQILEEDKDDIATLIGNWVKISESYHCIVGIYKTTRQFGSYNLFVPFSVCRNLYMPGNNVQEAIFAFKEGFDKKDIEEFQRKYRERINLKHNVAPSDTKTLFFWSSFIKQMEMQQGINIVNIALWIIGILTLLGGIVGVSNISLISVKERIREIGIRKALGARPKSILWMIISESITITTLFGYIGMVLGLLACEWMDIHLAQNTINIGVAQLMVFSDPTVGLGVAIQATLLLVIAGTLAGLFPALRATKIKPVEALNAN